jgi:uracil-DNA glycosylase
VTTVDNRLREPLDALVDRVESDWRPALERWRNGLAGRMLIDFVDARASGGALVYPGQVFRALESTPLSRTRVVILGQDPYHGTGQAEGLSFSVPAGQPLPPSLRNIYKEAQRDLGWARPPRSGHLGAWAESGVLLLNTSLTVEDGRPGSHSGKGWELLTDDIIAAAAVDPAPRVFLLWGAHAQSKAPLILAGGAGRHLVLQSNHPSPLSATRGPQPFIGCGHFSQARDFLRAAQPQSPPLTWDLE